ncbi:MAG: hypothetical protein WBP81_06125 [Solirubrobacteraceae bacterium]
MPLRRTYRATASVLPGRGRLTPECERHARLLGGPGGNGCRAAFRRRIGRCGQRTARGTLVVEYSGTDDQSFVDQPSDPAFWQATMHFEWDERETVALSGREQARPTTKVLSSSLTISGKIVSTYAAPHSAMSCSGTLSARPGAPNPEPVVFRAGRPALLASAILPELGKYVQSSAAAGTDCAVGSNTGFGVGSLQLSAARAFGEAEAPEVSLGLPTRPFSRDFPAQGSDPRDTESLQASFRVTACGRAAAGRESSSCSACPTPADLRLVALAEQSALDIFDNVWQGDGTGRDGRAESTLVEIKRFAKKVGREYPRADGRDREQRKRLMSAEFAKLKRKLNRLRRNAERAFDSAQARYLKAVRCPEAKQKIRDAYAKQRSAIDRDYRGDVKFLANEVIGGVNLFCGCHLSADFAPRSRHPRHQVAPRGVKAEVRRVPPPRQGWSLDQRAE